jgi:hypothetical protein
MLVLSANARPLNTSGGTGNTGFAGLLNGNAAEWSTSTKGGIGGQLYDVSLLPYYNSADNLPHVIERNGKWISNIVRSLF